MDLLTALSQSVVEDFSPYKLSDLLKDKGAKGKIFNPNYSSGPNNRDHTGIKSKGFFPANMVAHQFGRVEFEFWTFEEKNSKHLKFDVQTDELAWT